MINLKNIDISKVNLKAQLKKCLEEETEFYEAYNEALTKESEREHLIEEFYDCMQSKLGLLYKLGISAYDVMEYYPKHLEKLKHRPRD